MSVIGITGGIGTGKSTVTQFLLSKNYRVIDADGISRQITNGRTETVEKLAQAFGKKILKEDGTLNRQALADQVFGNQEREKLLEKIVTQKVVSIIEKQVSEAGEELVFMDVPLLFETGLDRLADSIWVVTACEELRIRRVMERDKITCQQVKSRMKCQMPEEEKLKRATVILDNSGDKETLFKKIEMELEKNA